MRRKITITTPLATFSTFWRRKGNAMKSISQRAIWLMAFAHSNFIDEDVNLIHNLKLHQIISRVYFPSSSSYRQSQRILLIINRDTHIGHWENNHKLRYANVMCIYLSVYIFFSCVSPPGKRDFKTLLTIKDPKNIFTVP